MLKSFDFFGEKVQLNINDKTSGQTYLGGVLFLLTVILVALSAWLIGKDLYFKKNPINNEQTIISGNYPKVNLNSSSFPIAVSLVDNNGYFMDDPRFLQIKFEYYEYKTLEDGTFTLANLSNIEIAQCKHGDFASVDKTFFETAKLDKFLCPQKPIDLQGYWSEYSLTYLSVTISACDYDQRPEYCASKQEIDIYIAKNSVNVNLGLLDYVVSFDNYQKPITPFFYTPYKFLTDQLKISSIMIQQDQILTDGGFFFEDHSSVDYLKAITLFDDSALFNPITKQYANIDFYSSNQYTVIYRRYIKIPDILAFVGGILKVVNILFFYVNLKFSQIGKYRTIIENLFNFDDDVCLKFNKSIKVDNPRKERYDSKFEHSFSIKNYTPTIGNPNKEVKLPEKTIKKLKLTLFDYVQIILNQKFKFSKNAKIYEKAQVKIKHYFDMLVIIKFIHEFQFFKDKILSNDSLQELNSHKPSISLVQDQFLIHESCLKGLNINNSINLNI